MVYVCMHVFILLSKHFYKFGSSHLIAQMLASPKIITDLFSLVAASICELKIFINRMNWSKIRWNICTIIRVFLGSGESRYITFLLHLCKCDPYFSNLNQLYLVIKVFPKKSPKEAFILRSCFNRYNVHL